MKYSKGIFAALAVFMAAFTVLGTNTVSAAGQSCVWTGAGGNSNFSTATNWSSCGGGAPTATDNVSFDVSGLSANTTLNNDLSGVTLANFTVSGTNSNQVSYRFSGTTTLTGTITGYVSLIDGASFVLGGNSTIAASSGISGGALNVGSNTLTLNGYSFSDVSGSGVINVNANGDLNSSSNALTGFTGTVNVLTNGIFELFPASLGSAAQISVNGGMLYLCGFNGASSPNALSVGGVGKVVTTVGCGMGGDGAPVNSQANVVWSGPITLTANTEIDGVGVFKVTGALSGSFTLKQKAATAGSVVIESSNNTSLTANGAQTTEYVKSTYSGDNQSSYITVNANNDAVLTGTYNSAYVYGGIFSGTGTLVGVLNQYGGKVAPGMSPGCLTMSDYNATGGTLSIEIGGQTACTQYDQLKVSTSVSLTNVALEVATYGGFAPVAGQKYTIIEQGGSAAVTGTFNGLVEGAQFTQGGVVYKISYVGGTGNDVVLTVVTVPGVPNTGSEKINANPAVIALGTFMVLASLFVITKRSRA
jgi:hypothetical protein